MEMRHEYLVPKADTPRPQLPVVEVLGTPLANATAPQAIAAIFAPGRRRVCFLNAHCANMAAKNTAYRKALGRADLVLADGIGVELAARMKGAQIAENLNGTDLTPRVMREAAARGMSVFLFGGKPGTAERAAEAISAAVPGLRIAGTRDGYDGAEDATSAIAAINESGADIVLVAMGVPRQELWMDRFAPLLNAQITIAVGALFDFWAGNVRRAPRPVRAARMEWAWRLAMEPRRMASRYLIGNATFLAHAAKDALKARVARFSPKRVLDIAVSLGALAILVPFFVPLMIAIRLESRGPAMFRQTRVGKDGETFTLYKLRSMYLDAEERRAALLASSDREGICFKSKNDPRVTRIGRFIRRYSLDELPQILNVLKGDMSIVGPRPALQEEVAAYPPQALERLAVKPGLTGLWQVSGRADIGFERMIDMDVAYVRSQSLLLDLLLIGLTFRTVVSGRGAY
ncbi:WecB/TagA/CpsF family glycosyltransferase [Pseudoruegeria sp. SHC-113]|uniref:WecB/TagA/CpsF family glycosyltransferase n=1 Tax=Pseudoruegeria sp. SHC-113 TaxID=2855439 RepID=UPI0021BAEAA4|nr:WecB/TagA/CpsF family glycosyltransferase [Pseudoruegeria sp. SHC-113]MCT8160094.1 WecB/TagA/CpsF family glycosyltransferase [Pseudoruegeria sp. SHC-113]